jgi:hypothetical protein
MEELRSSETSVLTRATRRNILEDGIFQDVHLIHPNEYRIVAVSGSQILKTGSMKETRVGRTQVNDQNNATLLHTPCIIMAFREICDASVPPVSTRVLCHPVGTL